MRATNRTVILSGVNASRSEAFAQSKDPLSRDRSMSPRKEFSPHSLSSFAHAACGKALAAVLLLSSFTTAQTLTGTVKNSTIGKPAAGDEVVLLKLAQGMEEAGRTKTDAKGQFSFKLDDAQAPHLVRVIHQEVTYHRMAPPGTTSVELEVYDVGKKIDGIMVIADIMRIQAAQGQIEVIREFGVQNTSKPPRTQMNERNLEFYIPDGAQIIPDSATATTENGNPVKSAPVPEGEKNRYSFIFPLRPGLTRFEVAYQLPYSGSANLDPKSLYPLEHFVVMTPKAMQFTAAAASVGFKLINYPNEPNAAVQVASNTTPGQNLAFKVSGEGTLEAQESGGQGSNEGGQSAGSSTGGGTQANNRPGGGLGPPIDAPDPLQKYRWWILGGFAALLVVGGVYVASRQQSAARALARQKTGSSVSSAMQEEDDYAPAEILSTPSVRSAARPTSMLMEGIKEELFQLEVERKQGQISQADYDKAKAALDQTLERALKREAQRA
ncbi:MAG: carboxypeptidase-like regulatory domain-containing protein [Candidatus Sulfotelmatobacter sp.]